MSFPSRFHARALALAGVFSLIQMTSAQGTLADYRPGQELTRKSAALVTGTPGLPNWIGTTDHFWYTKSAKGGTEFLLVDAGAATVKPAFVHEKLASALSAAMGTQYTALTLPFAPPAGGRGGGAAGRGAAAAVATTSPLTFVDNESSIRFGSGGAMWTCTLSDYACTKGGPIPA